MTKLPYSVLLDEKNVFDPTNKAFRDMPEIVRMFQGNDRPMHLYTIEEDGTLTITDDPTVPKATQGQLDDIFDHLIEEREEYDAYTITGEMINQFMYAFPELKDAWKKLRPDQKWIFIEGVHYGITSKVNNWMGLKQV